MLCTALSKILTSWVRVFPEIAPAIPCFQEKSQRYFFLSKKYPYSAKIIQPYRNPPKKKSHRTLLPKESTLYRTSKEYPPIVFNPLPYFQKCPHRTVLA